MIKKTVLILLLIFGAGFANEYLVKVALTQDRLTPLAEKNLKIVGELENSAILIADAADLEKISSYSYQILDQNPQEGSYYLVRLIDSKIDLSTFGMILANDGNDYLIKINQGMLETLIKEKVMIKRLTLTPIVSRGAAPTFQFMYNSTVQEIVDLVNPDSVLSDVQRLQDFVTRYSTHDSCFAAANWIASKFVDYGCDSVFLQSHDPSHAPNVIGIKRGVVYPDSIYAVVCGHFDATSLFAPDIAPGADDNASGTAAVIEAARVMKDYNFEYSVRYIAFSGEEFGLYGSEYYAQLANSHDDSIIGVLNGDMIGYVDALPESLEVIAMDYTCEPLADFFIACADSYTTLLTRKRIEYAPFSDHYSFWYYGYVAICNIEDDWPVNPYYHEPGDTIGAGYNNNGFCTEVIKTEVAALATIAEPYHDPGIDEFEKLTTHNVSLSVYPCISKGPFTISYVLNEPKAKVTLNIYDVTGALVKSFSKQSPIIWNGTDDSGYKLPAGVYLLRIEPDQVDATAKLILLR